MVPPAADGVGGNRADAPPAAEALSDAQMAKVSDLVNNAEVAQGKLAQRKAKHVAVKSFASKMVKHHEQALREQAKLVSKLKVTPADSPAAASLKADGEKTLQSLQESDAASFDALYVKSQIDGHQKALELLDTLLIPSAKTPEVLDALRQGRAIVAQHLEEARALPTK
jgi:putative membrane protein